MSAAASHVAYLSLKTVISTVVLWILFMFVFQLDTSQVPSLLMIMLGVNILSTIIAWFVAPGGGIVRELSQAVLKTAISTFIIWIVFMAYYDLDLVFCMYLLLYVLIVNIIASVAASVILRGVKGY